MLAPSSTASSTADTVTVCAVCQVSAVNVRLDGDTSSPAPAVGVTVTVPVGSVFSFTVYVALFVVPDASVTVLRLGADTVAPAVSSSVIVKLNDPIVTDP